MPGKVSLKKGKVILNNCFRGFSPWKAWPCCFYTYHDAGHHGGNRWDKKKPLYLLMVMKRIEKGKKGLNPNISFKGRLTMTFLLSLGPTS